MNKLARALDNVEHEQLVELCDAWLGGKQVTLWQTFDLSETHDREDAAEWLAGVLESIDTFSRFEHEWKVDENDDVEDRVRPSGQYREDFDGDIDYPDPEWSGVAYPS